MKNRRVLITSNHVTHTQSSGKMFGPDSLSKDFEVVPFFRAGWLPLLIPAVELRKSDVGALLSSADLVVITGGFDVDPLRYGEDVTSPEVQRYAFRDSVDMLIIQEAIRRKKPLFAICRGIQILNVALGGSLYQDVPKDIPGALAHMQKDKEVLSHRVSIENGSFIHTVFGRREIVVNSFHHQAIKKLGKNLRVTARARDGVIEAVEHTHLPILGVQWHPEVSYAFDRPSQKLFAALATLSQGG